MCSFFVVFFTTCTILTDTEPPSRSIVVFTTCQIILLIITIIRPAKLNPPIVQCFKNSYSFHRPVFLLLVRFITILRNIFRAILLHISTQN